MNYADTEKIRFVLLSKGLRETSNLDDADVVILNTCSVRQRAEDKVFGLARRIKKRKQENPGLKVILTGCMASRARTSVWPSNRKCAYSRELGTKMMWVDHIVDIGDLLDLCAALGLEYHENETGIEQAYLSDMSAFVQISQGCDNFCSYCIVPYSRGKEVHRSYTEIHSQVNELVSQNYRRVTLLGQNVNSWNGMINKHHADFSDLLRGIDEIEGEYWLSFLTSHPKDLSEKLVEVLAQGTHICPYLNLPAQSGSNAILKSMNRHYSVEEYIAKIDIVRNYVPNIRLSSDVIVGFPGETEADFQQTVELVKRARFGMVYVSEYSPRPYTYSAKLEDNVDKVEKGRRKRELEEVQRSIMRAENEKIVGKTIDILVTGKGVGLARDLREVEFLPVGKVNAGLFIKAHVKSATASGLSVVLDV